MGLRDKEMMRLFPTGFFTGVLPDITACDRVEKKLREMQNAGKGFVAKSAERAYMTPDNIQTLPEMKEIVDVAMEEAGAILDVYRIKRDSHYITNMWANIANPNRRHNTHTHPNCLLSGILYIKTPLNCGPTVFFSPRHLISSLTPSFTEKTELNSDTFVFPAEKGRMVIWPSHMPHAVENGSANEDEDRIVVAFNIMIRGKIDGITMALDLG